MLSFQKNIVFLSLKIDFVLANSADPDEMLCFAAFHLGPQCLSKYPLKGFWSKKHSATFQLSLHWLQKYQFSGFQPINLLGNLQALFIVY